MTTTTTTTSSTSASTSTSTSTSTRAFTSRSTEPPPRAGDPSSMIEPTSQRAARLLGSTLASRYHVTDVLSERVTGAIFAAEDLATRARMAVRVLYPETAASTNA